ncbi:MAG TPA: hypothetical protein VJA00_03095 [Candidatus Omnitrophota bacterium]|nr:hypothetical protein [Candidatus Omnitrophota bacterium]
MKQANQTPIVTKSAMPHIVWSAYRVSTKHFLCDAVAGFGGFGTV